MAVAAGWLFRHHVPVLRRDVAAGRLTVKQFVIRSNGFLRVPGGGKQASLLEGWRPSGVESSMVVREDW